jgi:cobalt-zinc-cadmium efflux system outer membrane protein
MRSFVVDSLRCAGVLLGIGLLGSNWLIASEFSLQAAIDRASQVHPQLKILDARGQILTAEASLAQFGPQLRMGAEAENIVGGSPYTGTDQGEYTLTLSGVLERGMKRELRRAVAMRRLDMLGVERAIAELDVLADVNRRYLDFVESAAVKPLLQGVRDRQHELAKVLRQRHLAGALPEAVVLAAEAEAARLDAEYEQSLREERYAWQRLALLWGEFETTGIVPQPARLPTEIPTLISISDMLSKLRALPDVEFFASAQRIQEAELRLTQAERHRDIEWQLGVRRLNADSATAFVAGVSVPLGQSDRVDLRASADRARQQSLAAEGSQRLLELETVLIRAHGELVRDSEYLRIMDNEILPRLQRGVAQGAVALAAGAMTYMELAQIQRELLGAQRARLQSQINIYRGWVEIQRLTGELWVEPAQSGGKQ